MNTFYEHDNDKRSEDGLATTEWNELSKAVAGKQGLHLALDVNHKVGIGTTNPQSKLHVEGGVAIGATYSGTNVAPPNGLLVEGNVGIGTTNPSTKLDVNGRVKATSFEGDGSLLTDLNADNIKTGTISEDRLPEGFLEGLVDQSYEIGDCPELGGYVFMLSEDKKHGLVAATRIQSSCTWSYAQDEISKPDNHDEDGKKFTDWRLPTKYELNEMYQRRDDMGIDQDGAHWSSTEFNTSKAWYQHFTNGDQRKGVKDSYGVKVRAVRAF